MKAIPPKLQNRFDQSLRAKLIPISLHGVYKKWLKYYLDYCSKYELDRTSKESLPHFIRKLNEKKQTHDQQKQAVSALDLYYEIVKSFSEKKPFRHGTVYQDSTSSFK